MLTVALVLHLIGVCVWVGGQIVLAGLVPAIRDAAPDAETGRTIVHAAARRFQVIAWSGFGLVLFTGMWMLTMDVLGPNDTQEFFEKMGLVVIAVIGVLAHSFWIGPRIRKMSDPAKAKRMSAANGIAAGVALLASIGALIYGVLLVSGG